MIILIAILVIIAALVIWAIGCYNGFVKGENNIEEAFSTMDVYLKKRFDLIPNLVETVKGYATHEKSTLDAVIKARNAVSEANSTDAKMECENQLSGVLRQVFALAEAYPDLKADTHFAELMGQLESIELDIAQSRKYYNAVVKDFNIKLQAFPSSIIGSMFHYTKKAMYEADDTERQSVKVDFGTAAPAAAPAPAPAPADVAATQAEAVTPAPAAEAPADVQSGEPQA